MPYILRRCALSDDFSKHSNQKISLGTICTHTFDRLLFFDGFLWNEIMSCHNNVFVWKIIYQNGNTNSYAVLLKSVLVPCDKCRTRIYPLDLAQHDLSGHAFQMNAEYRISLCIECNEILELRYEYAMTYEIVETVCLQNLCHIPRRDELK